MLQAAAIGESGQVLVLDMGEPVRTVDLARDLIRLAGHSVDDVGIVFSGLRPGEKLYEELLADADDTLPTAVPRLRIAQLKASTGRVDELVAWAAACDGADETEVRERLRAAVAEFGAAAG